MPQGCWECSMSKNVLLQTEVDRSCQNEFSVPVSAELILLYLSEWILDTISYFYIA